MTLTSSQRALFEHQPPRTGDRVRRHEIARQAVVACADAITSAAEPSRELSLALTKLEEALYWANAAVTRQERPAAEVGPAVGAVAGPDGHRFIDAEGRTVATLPVEPDLADALKRAASAYHRTGEPADLRRFIDEAERAAATPAEVAP